ncbi:MAG TPA: hypothetical protein VHO70_18425 [Chitinispirillaceae bacterium]|nr:hypothetical protein [Chitinispirillaceae bacterium]
MPLSSLLKSVTSFLKKLPAYIDGHSDSEHKKSTTDTAGKDADNGHSWKNRDSTVPEDERQSDQQAERTDQTHVVETDHYIVDNNCSSDTEEQSSPEKNAKDVRNTTALDTTDEALMEKPVETTPDVYLDVPSLNVKELKLNVEDLDAKVALNAELAGLIKINVGVTAGIKKLDLDIKDVDLKAVLKVRLKQVYAIFNRALDTIDNNPDVLKNPELQSGNTPSEIQQDSTVSNINSTKQMTSSLMDNIKKSNNPIETHHTIKKGEERHRFREDK